LQKARDDPAFEGRCRCAGRDGCPWAELRHAARPGLGSPPLNDVTGAWHDGRVMDGALLGWGYEGQTLEDLVSYSRIHGAHAVVDVRLNAISRRPGFSKGRLSARLAEHGLTYVHLRTLGNPRDNRDGFAQPGSALARRCHARFRDEVLSTEAGAVALDEIQELARNGTVVVLCYEADQPCCHRSLVIDAVQRRRAPATV